MSGNNCSICGVDLGMENPRQLCGKTRCYAARVAPVKLKRTYSVEYDIVDFLATEIPEEKKRRVAIEELFSLEELLVRIRRFSQTITDENREVLFARIRLME